MKILKYILILFCVLSITACFDDNTTLDTVRISEINIDTLKMQKIYNIDHHEQLTISTAGIVTETEEQLPLHFEWEVDYKLYSEEANLEYIGKEIGAFPVRLKVSNKHGSSFYEFTINVNTAYQTGIAILSENAEGIPMFSFMRELSDSELAAGKEKKFVTNCLQVNNPDAIFPKHPTDFGIRKEQVFICFKDEPAIYMLNGKMLNIENIVTDPSSEFIPEKLLIANSAARVAVVITPKGKVYQFGSVEGIILPHPKFTSEYAANIGLVASLGYQDATILWDAKESAIIDFYGGYYLFSTKDQGLDFSGHTPIALYDRDGQYFTMLTRKGDIFMKTSIAYTWMINDGYDENYKPINPRFGLSEDKVVISGSPKFNAQTPYAVSKILRCMYYADGNNIYRWFFNSGAFETKPWKTLDDIEGAQITAISISKDEKQLYVGVNRVSKDESKSGSLYILNSDTGKNEDKSPYLNIAYKPIRIMYKQ